MIHWQRQGQYEYGYDEHGYTGWVRCVGGQLADGRWPCWNYKTGARWPTEKRTQ